jgi:hypothetical protein
MSEPEPKPSASDPNALVQAVLRESYLQTTEDLRYYAERTRSYNERRKASRAYLGALRDFRVAVCRAAPERDLADAFKEHSRPYDAPDFDCELSIPNRVPAEGVADLEQLDAEIRRWEEKLNSIGDDAQLANVDLQNVLQKQQQTLQMMSNISKMLHDTAMSVIRKMGG